MRIFLGSTRESIRLVHWASRFLAENLRCSPIPWDSPKAFPAGTLTIEALERLSTDIDGVILFVTADDLTEHRGASTFTPRDNIVFEAGLFLGTFGRGRTHLVVERGTALRLPSDWAGITHESFTRIDDIGATLSATVSEIVDSLRRLGPRPVVSRLRRELPKKKDLFNIEALVGGFRRVIEEVVYPRVSLPDVREVDVLVAYRFYEVVKRTAPNLGRRDVQLRLCFSNMWDPDLMKIYRRKYIDRSPKHIQNAIKDGLTVLFGPLQNWRERKRLPPIFRVVSPPTADVQVYATNQRVTHAYYRVDDWMCVVPLDMKKPADPQPLGWVFVKDEGPFAYDHYRDHFDHVLKESTRLYGRRP